MEIRQEINTDYRETENVVREAFWNVYVPGCSEHYLVHIMRDCPAFVKELDLVTVDKGKIVGHVANLRAYIEGDDSKRHEVLTLGPISVLPFYQRQGIGSKLIAEVKRRAKQMGFQAILLCGNPAFYTKQGFIAAERYGIRTSDNMFADALQVCGLKNSSLSHLAGKYYEDEIYNVNDIAVKEFDRQFPDKVPVEGTPSQKLFLKLVSQCKPYTPGKQQ